MIDCSDSEGALVILATPNHSSTWRANLLTLLAISIPSVAAAIGFALMGAWPILPFAGAELAALGGALYYVNWKLQYRHVIRLDEREIRIDKGHYAPRRTWILPRSDVSLAVTTELHPWDGPALALHSRSHHISIGEFLNRDDALELLALLRRQLPLRTHSPKDERHI